MAKKRTRSSADAIKQLRELATWLRIERIAQRVWSKVLSAADRECLGEDYDLSKLIQGYAQLRGCSLERSAVDLAFEGRVIGAAQHRCLRRDIGEPIEEINDQPRPIWNSDTGELIYRNKVVRKVSRKGSEIRKILDAFHEQRWPLRIDNPLPGGRNSKRLRDTLESLRYKLRNLTFEADGSASGVLWRIAPKRRRSSGA